MFGQTELTPLNILKYGLTKEFFEQFSLLKYDGIEIAPVLMRYFHSYIREFVQGNYLHEDYVKKVQERNNLFTIVDAQKALLCLPEPKKYGIRSAEKKGILMTTPYLDFAVDHLAEYTAVVLLLNERDRELVKIKRLPGHIRVYDLYKEIAKVKIEENILETIFQQKKKILYKNRKHEIFGKQHFQTWLSDRRIVIAIQLIEFIKRLIYERNVALMLDHTEVINPGILFGLFSHKLNIPFILAPQLVMTDRSLIPTRATHYFVWGKNHREWLAKRGIAQERMVEGGNLRYYYQMKQDSVKVSRGRFRRIAKVPEEYRVVTYLTQSFPFGESFKTKLLQWIKYSVKDLPIIVIIRPHPADKYDYRTFVQKEEKFRFIQTEKISLYNVIRPSDAVMTISSNTALESLLLKKPLITLQPPLPVRYDVSDNDVHTYLARGKAGAVIHNKIELKKVLTQFVNDPQYRKKLIVQGQTFLKNTLNLEVEPPIVLKNMIQDLLTKS